MMFEDLNVQLSGCLEEEGVSGETRVIADRE